MQNKNTKSKKFDANLNIIYRMVIGSSVIFLYHVCKIWILCEINLLIDKEKIALLQQRRVTMIEHINEAFENHEISISVSRGGQNENMEPPSYNSLYPNSSKNPPKYDSIIVKNYSQY